MTECSSPRAHLRPGPMSGGELTSSLNLHSNLKRCSHPCPFLEEKDRNKQAQERGRSWGEVFGIHSTQGTVALGSHRSLHSAPVSLPHLLAPLNLTR